MAVDAQYVIEIASRMTGAETTDSQLAKLNETLIGGGKGAQHFQDAIVQLEAELKSTRAIASDANGALASGQEQYRSLEQAALEAARALDLAGLASAGAVPPELKAQLDAANAAVKAGAREFTALERAVARASAAVAKSAAANAGVASADSLAKLQASNDALTAGRARLAEFRDAAAAAAVAVKSAGAASAVTEKALAQDRLTAANAALAEHADKLRAMEAAAAGAAAKEQGLNATLGNTRKLAANADKTLAGQSEAISKVQGALGQIGGPVGKLGQALLAPKKGFADLSQVMGAGNAKALLFAGGIGIAVVAVVAITAAVVAGLVKIAAWGIGLADAARKAGLAREAADALDPSLAALRGDMDAIARDTGVAGDALGGLAKSLKDAKVPADDMPAALRAAATAEAALGQGGAASFIADIKAGKLAVDEFAATTQAKLGGIVARQMLGLEAQTERFKLSIGSLFGGMNIEPALGGLQTLVALFDKGTASGSAIKLLFEGIFQPFVDKTQSAAYVVEAFVLGVEIGLVKLYIKVKPLLASIADMLGFDDVSLADVLTGAKKAGEFLAPVFLALAVVFGTLIAIVAVSIGIILAIPVVFAAIPFAVAKAAKAVWAFLQGPIKAVSGAVDGAITAVADFGRNLVASVGAAFTAVKVFFGSLNWGASALGLVKDLAGGIASAAGAVVDAVVGVVDSMIDALGLDTWGAKGAALLRGIASGITGAIVDAVAAVVGVVSSVVATVTGADWLGLGASIISGILGGVAGLAGSVGAAFSGLVASVKGVLGNVGEWIGVGGDIVSGMVQGITGAAGRVVGAVADMAKGAIAKAKSVLGIGSPSKVMAEQGQDTGAGMVVGVEQATGEVQDAMAEMVAPPEPEAIALPEAVANDNAVAAPSPAVAQAANDNAAPVIATEPATEVDRRVAAVSSGAGGGDGAYGSTDQGAALAAYDALSGAAPPVASASAPAAQAPAAPAPTGGANITGNTFVLNGIKDAADAEKRIGDLLTKLIEGDVAALGKTEGQAA